jgi:teichuronic acid biosynthesis glycosyltransferase TuaG
MSFHQLDIINSAGVKILPPRSVLNRVSYHSLLSNNTIGCPSVMLNKDLYSVPIQFEESDHEDFLLWLTLLKNNPLNGGVFSSLGAYRIHDKSRSANKIKAALARWKIYRQHERLSLLQSLFYFTRYAWTALSK